MTQKIQTLLIDDLDGSEAKGTRALRSCFPSPEPQTDTDHATGTDRYHASDRPFCSFKIQPR
jgi:hypothetical protein